MTTPCICTIPTGQIMEFVLPARFKEDAPQPRGAGVEVYQSKRYFAAIRYSGFANTSKKKTTPRPCSMLKTAHKKVLGNPVVLSYDVRINFITS